MTAWTVTTITLSVLLVQDQKLLLQAHNVFPALPEGVGDVPTYGWRTLTMRLFARCQGSWHVVSLVGRPRGIQPVLLETVGLGESEVVVKELEKGITWRI